MTAEDEMRALWSSIPDVGCLGLCERSCGPIGMSDLEREILNRHMPFGFPRMVDMLRDLVNDHEAHCPLLVRGRCSAYDDRPTICRLYAAEDGMPCPYGCAPKGGRLAHGEGSAILQASLDIGGDSESIEDLALTIEDL